jgi:3',5'-cyclic AMP phosphodiesterase CpdA
MLTSLVLAQTSDPKVIGGPYVVNVGQRSATVVWVVETGEVTFAEAGKAVKTIPVLRAEKTVLNALRPGTTYQYQAFPVQFVVYGDTRTRHDVHRSVIQGVLRSADPDFVMHTGDLVENGSDSSLWPIFFDAERELLRKAPIFTALGNHERHAKNYFEFMDAKPYYSFNWGSAHFIVIDSDLSDAAPTAAERDAFWAQQTRWLEEDLSNSQKSDFRFVFAHHPPMTAVKRRQGDNPHMTALEPMFEKYHVNVGFFGHDHNYQHYLKNGIQYFVTGGGGAPLYDVDAPPPGITKKVESTENFLIVNIDGASAKIEARRPNGDVIETTSFTEGGK